MIEALLIWRGLFIALAVPAVLWMTPSPIALMAGRHSRYDPIWSLLWFILIVWMLFSGSWIVMPTAQRAMSDGELAVRFGLQTLTLLCLAGIVGVRRYYGRG